MCAHRPASPDPITTRGAVRATLHAPPPGDPPGTLCGRTLIHLRSSSPKMNQKLSSESVSPETLFFPIRFLAYYVAETVLKVKFEGHGFQAGL